MGNQWEDDDDDYLGEEESTDMVDLPVAVSKPSPSPIVERRRLNHQNNSPPVGKPKRSVRVRPMPAGMIQKWPDVVSCLLTLGSGKQVLFVKGG